VRSRREREREIFEHLYYKFAAKAQEIIRQELTQGKTKTQTVAQGENRKEISNIICRRPKMLKIKLPEFNGDYTKRLFFKDSFETTIHKDDCYAEASILSEYFKKERVV